MRLVKKFLLIAVASLLLMSQSMVMAATYDSLQAFGVDTIAGYSTLLSTSKTYPNQDIVLSVNKPDGSTISIPAKTDVGGVAKVDLYDYHTRRAGDYYVSAYLKGYSNDGPVSTFRVYPDEVSVEKSSIVAQKSVVKADGNDKAYLTVNIVDQYGNPFTGHVVKVISSRAGDYVNVSTYGSTTDINGSVTFTASSLDPGVSIFSAVDATSGIVLASRANVAFLNNSNYLDDAGGFLEYYIPVASAEDAGPLNKFEISGIPEIVAPNTNVSFSVTAQDVNGLTVENFTGEIHFSAEGPSSINVTLPEDYTFKAEDLGEHQFSLGLKFIETGTYKIVATNIDDQNIKGEKNVAVSTGSIEPPSGSGLKPSISSLVAGTYSQNVQTISGDGPALSTIRIFDNDQEIGTTQAGSDGKFSFETLQLSDGEHAIYVVTLDESNEVQGTSDTVIINIDTTAPTIDETEISPSSGISAGDVITVKVMSEENLSQAALIFNLEIYDLSPSLEQDGAYVASFQAPAEAGEYPLEILLVDELGNEATYTDVAIVSIGPDGGSVITEEDGEEEVPEEEVVTEPELASQPPSQVFGVIAYGADNRVTLVWEASTDDGVIDNYKIYYGIDPQNLTDSVNTKDPATTWYVPDLLNGKEYYFAVSAVDNDGIESLMTSALVSGIPFTLEVDVALPERPQEPLSFGEEEALLRGAAVDRLPSEMVKNGPELIWLLVGTGTLSGLARKFSRRKRR